MEHVVTTRIVSEPDPGEYYTREAYTVLSALASDSSFRCSPGISFSFGPAAMEKMHVLWSRAV